MSSNLGRKANTKQNKVVLTYNVPNLRDSNVLPTQKLMMLLVQLNQLNCNYADDTIDSLR